MKEDDDSDKNSIALVIDLVKEWIRTNRWKAFALITLSAALTIVYINNVMQINRLMEEVQNYERESSKIRAANEALNLKVLELESAERIIGVSEDKLGMIRSEKAPTVLP